MFVIERKAYCATDDKQASNMTNKNLQMKVTCPFASMRPTQIKMTHLSTNEEFIHVNPCISSSSQKDQFPSPSLAGKTLYGVGCQDQQCHGAMMDKYNQPQVDPNRSPDQIWLEAQEFLDEFYRDAIEQEKSTQSLDKQQRLEQVKKEIDSKGTYFQTTAELEYGVKLAWRNSSRCIMRIQWKNINVVDARGGSLEHVKKISNEEIYDKCVQHLHEAVSTTANTNGTSTKVINSKMTVFPQLLPGEDFGRRIWNPQLLRFAGYIHQNGNILGDPAHVEFTKICLQLGWKPPVPRTAFDVLPLVIQANDNAKPLLKNIPKESVLIVPISHPEYPKVASLKLKWHAIPAISSFTIDIGGIQYPCAPFNGWYMDAEIACRNLADPQRYNLLPSIAKAMGYPVMNTSSIKDKALVELNNAVLHSFCKAKITLVDHFTASESFTRHYKKEMATRGFIPGDWVWMTPPIGGAANTVFHQEMINFFIKPNFLMPKDTVQNLYEKALAKHKQLLSESQQLLQEEVEENKKEDTVSNTAVESIGTKRQIKRIYVYFGSETGKSENYASDLLDYFEQVVSKATTDKIDICAFDALDACNLDEMVHSLSDNDDKMDSNTWLIIVTSTFGAGGPPTNAQRFHLFLEKWTSPSRPSSSGNKKVQVALFGLGNSIYRDFNAFVLYVDTQLRLKGPSTFDIVLCSAKADEKKANEYQVFNKWRRELLTQMFKGPLPGLTDSVFDQDKEEEEEDTEMIPLSGKCTLYQHPMGGMNAIRRSSVSSSTSTGRKRLSTSDFIQEKQEQFKATYLGKTVLVDIQKDKQDRREVYQLDFHIINDQTGLYHDGDHLAILPRNEEQNVHKMLEFIFGLYKEKMVHQYVHVDMSSKVSGFTVPDFLKGQFSLKQVLSEHIDLNAPPSFQFIQYLSSVCSSVHSRKEKIRLDYLALCMDNYQEWLDKFKPTQIDFFELFPILVKTRYTFVQQEEVEDKDKEDMDVELGENFVEFFMYAPRMQPRLYSISSSSIAEKDKVSITVKSTWTTNERRGLCSQYLWNLQEGTKDVRMYVSASTRFHLKMDSPIILIANGTGIAPFRSFWRTLFVAGLTSKNDGGWFNNIFDAINLIEKNKSLVLKGKRLGPQNVHLYYGCRTKKEHLYKEEIKTIFHSKSVHIAYSRQKNNNKTTATTTPQYITEIVQQDSTKLKQMVFQQNAKVYVCGSLQMAQQISSIFLKSICDGDFKKFNQMLQNGQYVEEVF